VAANIAVAEPFLTAYKPYLDRARELSAVR